MQRESAPLVLFLDDGGVISDNSRRAPQWQRLVGEFFPPILGGTAEEWKEANKAFTTAIFAPGAWEARLKAAGDYPTYEHTYLLDWLEIMCELVGVPQPPEAERLPLVQRANAWIIPQVRADFAGVVDTIRLLHSRGHTLCTASGESSGDLEGYLGALGVRDFFTRLYGGDLINTLKAGPQFYERILVDAGVAPSQALFVDDNPGVIAWVSEVGALGVLVDSQRSSGQASGVRTIGSLVELPEVIDALG